MLSRELSPEKHDNPKPGLSIGPARRGQGGIAALFRRFTAAVRGYLLRYRHRQRLRQTAALLQRLDRDEATGRDEYQHIFQVRAAHLVPVGQPLVLISQIQRSGGTLLGQLFDQHPQCHAHPSELKIGKLDKWTWPTIDLHDPPAAWFQALAEEHCIRYFKEGFSKYGVGTSGRGEVFPFLFPVSLQKALFNYWTSSRPIRTPRDVFDGYFTSFFNAWLDNHNLYGEQKRVITAFVPRITMYPDSLQRFFTDYPDGRLISVVRDPLTWYASARRHQPEEYGDLERAVDLWTASTVSIIRAKERYGSHVFVVNFTQLIDDTEATMRELARFLGIDFHPILLTPTFNGCPIKANSSFAVEDKGVMKAPLQRHETELTPTQRHWITERTGETLAKAVQIVGGC